MRLKQGTFGVFPAYLLHGRPAYEQLVLSWIWFHKNNDGKCFPSIKKLSEETSLSQNSIRKALDGLTSRGLLSVVPRYRENGSQSSNEYGCLIDPPACGEGGGLHDVKGGASPQVPLLTKAIGPDSENTSPVPSKPAFGLGNPPIAGTPLVTNQSESLGCPVEHDRASVRPETRPRGSIVAGQGRQPASGAARETWLTAYAEAWKAKAGGEMPMGEAARTFKRLEASHGRESILTGWQRYCRETEARFLSVHRFASTIGVYLSSPTKGMFIKPATNLDNIL